MIYFLDELHKHFSTVHPCEPVYVCKRASADPRNVSLLLNYVHLNMLIVIEFFL